MGTQQKELFRNLLFTVVCVGAGLKKGANGEEGQEESEDCATGVVLVEKLHIASIDMRSSC